jgi:sugar/nucleoside kinase (ribokinase family)
MTLVVECRAATRRTHGWCVDLWQELLRCCDSLLVSYKEAAECRELAGMEHGASIRHNDVLCLYLGLQGISVFSKIVEDIVAYQKATVVGSTCTVL